MAVRVGSARIDENGNISGGRAGDQTGGEVAAQDWYRHSLGWYVIRAKSADVRERIARDMEYACANDNIGYDQNENYTLWNVVKPLGFDCSKVTTPCETDCARLVRVCVWYAGIEAPDFYTGNELRALGATGEFDILTDSKYCDSSDYLLRGDILVTRSQGHTVVVLSNGSKAEETGGTSYVFSAQTVKSGERGTHVLLLQEILRARDFKGKDGNPLKLSWVCDTDTVYAINAYQTLRRKQGVELGTNGKNDSTCGPKMWSDLVALPKA